MNEPFILTECGQGYRRILDAELAKKSLEISPVLEIGRTDIITHFLTKSDMISYLPDFVTKEGTRSGELCYLDVVDVNRLLKQFEGMQQIIKQVTGGRKPGFGFGGLGHGRGLRKRKKK